MDCSTALGRYEETHRKMQALHAGVSLLHWDMETIMPPKAGQKRAQVMSTLIGEAFRVEMDPAHLETLETLNSYASELSPTQRRSVEEELYNVNRMKNVPQSLIEENELATSTSTMAWKESKANNDFVSFVPHLQKVIDLQRQIALCIHPSGNVYDTLLEGYDRSLLSEQISPVFATLKAGIVELLGDLKIQPAIEESLISPDRQKLLASYLMEEIGFDLKAGNLFETEHPFTTTIHQGDVRLTTKYIPESPQSSIFSVLHEAGHGIYEQNINPELDGTPLGNAASMGLHESQSRFYENIVGRSLAFWQPRFDKVNALVGTQLAGNVTTFWKGINRMHPSLIRIESDELTYNLHIIIRYELEKKIFNEDIKASDLAELWKNEYKSVLGVSSLTDTDGVLQDTHWGSGLFGYFPSYAIGNLYSAQLANALEKECGPLDSLVGTKEGLLTVRQWLTKNIHHKGFTQTASQIMLDATSQELSSDAFLSYMRRKLTDLSR
jgi:carboxypeptidase Taq